jgi:hypothetical protein
MGLRGTVQIQIICQKNRRRKRRNKRENGRKITGKSE